MGSLASSDFAGFLTPAASLSEFGAAQLPARGSDAGSVTHASSLGEHAFTSLCDARTLAR